MQCYEGLKAFRAPDDKSITIFRPSMNAERMQHSASFISIPEIPSEHFLRCVRLAVALNADYVPPHHTGAAMYIRPLLFGSSAQLGLNPPEEYTFLVYVLPTGVYHGTKPVKALILEEFDRAAPEGTGSAKVGGNYAPVLRWSEKAYKEGYGITLHLDSKTRTEIEEFSTSGFIGVKKDGENVTLVVPDSKRVIKSITSESVQEIAKSFGWKVEVRPVRYFLFIFLLEVSFLLIPPTDSLPRTSHLHRSPRRRHSSRPRVHQIDNSPLKVRNIYLHTSRRVRPRRC
jgi:branched-chain amino acid aminotransferase